MQYDKRIRDELIQIARGNSPVANEHKREEAEQNWNSKRFQPMLALLVIVFVSSVAIPALACNGLSGYFATFGVCAAVAIVIIRMNAGHKKAYVDLKISQGMKRHAAEMEYHDRYSGS